MHLEEQDRKYVVALAVLVLGLLAFGFFRGGLQSTPKLEDGKLGRTERASDLSATTDPSVDREERRSSTGDPADAPPKGSLVVKILYDDEQAAADIAVRVRPARGDRRVGSITARTDEDGTVRFEGLEGYFKVDVDRSLLARQGLVRIHPGQVAELKLVLAVAQEIEGVVVDPSGRGVEGAAVYLASVALLGVDAAIATHTDRDGRFEIRSGFNPSVVWAVAAGYEPSITHSVGTASGGSDELRLVLPRVGASFTGTVKNASGERIANALVRVGSGRLDAIRRMGEQPRAQQVRSDEKGAFLVHGVPEGEHRVDARADGYCLTSTRASARPGQVARVDLVLRPESIVRGVVRNQHGELVQDARFSWGEVGTLEHVRARTDRYGRYTLRGLPAGPLSLRCVHREFGSASKELTTLAGETHDVDWLLEPGRVFRADIVDSKGTPVEGVSVLLESEEVGGDGKLWRRSTRSDSAGLALLNSLPPGRFVALLRAPKIESLTQRNIDPDVGELLFRVRRRAEPTASVRGQIQDPLLQAFPNARVMLLGVRSDVIDYEAVTDHEGRFELQRVRDGRYLLHVEAEGCARHASGPVDIRAHTKLELPAIAMSRGGSLSLQLGAPAGKQCRVNLFDMDGQWLTSMLARKGSNVLRAIAPGRYRVTVECKGLATRSSLVDIVASRQTKLALEMQKGLRRVVELEPGAQTVQIGRARIRLRLAGALVLDEFEDRLIRRKALTLWLAAGRYEIEIGEGRSRVKRSFEVQGGPGAASAALRIDLP